MLLTLRLPLSHPLLSSLSSFAGSGNLLAENFNPVMYLLENHCGTSFEQLRNGCQNLRSEVERSKQAPGQFIQENLEAFITCYTTLSDILQSSI